MDKCSRGRYQPLLLLYATPQPQTNQQQQQQPTIQADMITRRAITPSPEKPPIGSTRRAITPTPNRTPCDYQNLSVIQSKIFPNEDMDEYVRRKSLTNAPYQNLNSYQETIFPYHNNNNNGNINNSLNGDPAKDGYINHQSQIARKQPLNLHRSLSAESATVHQDGLSIPEHLNQPRRRDSGNWSGDRNSASSSSSTTLENPYLYLVGKRNGSNGSGSHPPSPTRNGHIYDAGYDSYSLSSTDSYPPKQHNSQLAKIPESVVVLSGDCERLCMEADQFLEKSKITEDVHDLETALVLCNAAAGKARAAMEAPYSNPHTMTFARMKHNTCVMRARSLHRRILVEKGGEIVKDQQYIPEIRHSREGSNSSVRQLRQNTVAEKNTKSNTKSIEIYATLPKKGKSPLKLIESEGAIEYEKPKPERESRSIFGRKNKEDKRSRSEDRNKISREFSIAEPLLANAKDTLKKHKEDKEEKKDKDKSGKKQHKVRRKLLMGGLMKRKNRSMPDLTEANDAEPQKEAIVVPIASVDDSSLGINNGNTMSGYLSEGHFEYQTISSTNPNLERSKLMRKSFHGSGRQLTNVKVIPPPPPIRTNSTLSQQQLQLHHQKQIEQDNMKLQPFHQANASVISNMSSNTSMSEDSCQTIITCAVVHQEQSPMRPNDQQLKFQQFQQPNNEYDGSGVDEVDCHFGSNLELPPYPSPPVSAIHSRQASEDFPPPPPNMEVDPINDHGDNKSNSDTVEGTTSILVQLQQRQQILKMRMNEQNKQQQMQKQNQQQINEIKSSESWLKEMQTKQSTLKKNEQQKMNAANVPLNNNMSSVRDLASRFEQIKLPGDVPTAQPPLLRSGSSQELLSKPQIRTGMNGLPDSLSRSNSTDGSIDEVDCAPMSNKMKQPSYLTLPKTRFDINQSQIAEEIREVEMLNTMVQQTLNNSQGMANKQRTKKKSVSFCDQVILVATADNQEDDDFIPNPILERVLRTANYNGDADKSSFVQLSSHQQNMMRLQNEPAMRHGVNVMNGPPNGMNGTQNDAIKSKVDTHRQNMEIQKQIQQDPRVGGYQPNGNINEQQQKQMMFQQTNPSPINFGEQMPRSQHVYGQDISRTQNASDISTLNGQQQQQQQQRQGIPNGISNLPAQIGQEMQNYASHDMRRTMLNDGSRLQFDDTQMQQSNYLQDRQQNPQILQNPHVQYYVQQQQQQHQSPPQQSMQSMQSALQPNVYQKPPLPMNYIQQNGQQQQQQQQSYVNGYNSHDQSVLNKLQQQNNLYMSPYQRVPMPHGYSSDIGNASPIPQNIKQSPTFQQQQYFAAPITKPSNPKKVSFEPGTKSGSDCGGPLTNQSPLAPNNASVIGQQMMQQSTLNVTAIPTRVYNNNAIVKASAKAVCCNLCRKKHVMSAMYCSDCEFYMSRFQPQR